MRHFLFTSIVGVTLTSLGCSDAPDASPPDTAPPPTDQSAVVAAAPGRPIPGLTANELASFETGREAFSREFADSTGLGPLFNSFSCAECHEAPVVGGGGDEAEIQATAFIGGTCDDLSGTGGPVVQQHATPALHAALGIDKEPDLPGATSTAVRSSPPLFGLGLLDAVSDETIKALARISHRDGVHGRAHILADGRVGRFGRKAGTASLRLFNDGAWINEMGITNSTFPVEGTVAGMALPPGVDPISGLEIDDLSLAAASSFVQFLAPVAPAQLSRQAKLGAVLFAGVGCASCHVPLLPTGPSPVKALRFRLVAAYTDLLLHDMGPGLADICVGSAAPQEFRTQPLMGTRFRESFLHDGRASTVEQATDMHGGEASVIRDRFMALPAARRAAIVAFLMSL